MSYYKITFESNTIEGLKAIQGSLLGNGTTATDSTTFKTPVPSPPPTQDKENLDEFSGSVQAPPTAKEAGAGIDFSDENSFSPPPPKLADSAMADIGSEGEIPPPKDNLPDQQGN